MAFDTLLIANRGEIAVRIARTARRMGIRTVAVHSDADAHAPHVRACDVAVAVGPAPAAESYLVADRIIDAARRTGAQAVHPGYGFLAENAAFAQAVLDAGLVWVGPPPEAIRVMGDKAAAKRRMQEASVPVVPGYNGTEQDDDRLLAEAEGIGFPLMVKAAAGGGGKGMRLVEDADWLPGALSAARRESAAAFGDDTLLLERAVMRPRHVEIQVMADAHGHCIHLGERDCSVQRRHQKVLEESPSPAVDADLRTAMGAAGVAAAKAVDYVGAGTIEFLLDDAGTFYFLEMNTRLQVEHPVTELVTGLDLVELQLRVARGEHLGIAQEDVRLHGHAIEARLYAEDPARDYLPATGTVFEFAPPSGDGVRVDAGIETGSEITSYYDPMVAKVIAHGADRDEARRRLIRALERTTVLGPVTNRPMLIAALRADTFAGGGATTAFLDEEAIAAPKPTSAELAAIAAWSYARRRAEADARTPGLAGWSSAGALRTQQRLRAGDDEVAVELVEDRARLTIRVGADEHEAAVGGSVVIDGVDVELRCLEPEPGRIIAAFPAFDLEVLDLAARAAGAGEVAGEGELVAPMHGRIIAVDGEVGAAVTAGQRLVVMEAMKMEHEIVADIDGTVEEIVNAGAQVAADQVLVRITPGS